MAKILAEQGCEVFSSDLADYQFGEQIDFLQANTLPARIDWIATNPPFSLADDFCRHALSFRKQNPNLNVALLCRAQFVEGKARHSLFDEYPPHIFFYSERINFWAGELRAECNSAHCHAWFLWLAKPIERQLNWFGPTTKKTFTRDGDYPKDKSRGEFLPLVKESTPHYNRE